MATLAGMAAALWTGLRAKRNQEKAAHSGGTGVSPVHGQDARATPVSPCKLCPVPLSALRLFCLQPPPASKVFDLDFLTPVSQLLGQRMDNLRLEAEILGQVLRWPLNEHNVRIQKELEIDLLALLGLHQFGLRRFRR